MLNVAFVQFTNLLFTPVYVVRSTNFEQLRAFTALEYIQVARVCMVCHCAFGRCCVLVLDHTTETTD